MYLITMLLRLEAKGVFQNVTYEMNWVIFTKITVYYIAITNTSLTLRSTLYTFLYLVI